MNLAELNQPFSEDLFLQINKQLIDSSFTPLALSISPDSPKFITNPKYHGTYDNIELHIFTVEHSSTEDARVGVSMDIFKLMKKYSFQNAIIAAYSKTSDTWRYSLITSRISIQESGKLTKDFSNPRRYSFILGPDQKVLTPHKQLIQLGKVSEITELSKRFSLEVVNDDFYDEIAKLYDELIGTDKIVGVLTYPNSDDAKHEFSVRLIGRIIFCWFLREKKSKAGLSLISSEILSLETSKTSNYYHEIIAPLFFEILNKPVSKRTDKFQNGPFANVPYLNGGLFNDDHIDHYKFDKILELSVPGLVNVPDSWLRSFLELLERFNFTVDENTSYDTDLSIDPEMLGRVFENLLARINPETGETVRNSTGSFYTPREIVEYMVDVSLTEHLISKTKINKDKIEALVSYDLLDDIGNELLQEEKLLVLEALSTLTVLDPACGSGAFPIGMLQKIVFIVSQIDPKAEWWLAKQLENASPELRREFMNRSVDYVRKLGVIRQTIFGVDIQPVATEISRLRCFLTLIVDEEIDDSQEDRGIRPLPNLEFKFITANTLIKPPSENVTSNIAMFNDFESSLAEKVKEYFSSYGEDKISLLHDIRDLIDSKVDQNTRYVLNNYGIIKDSKFNDEFNRKNLKTNSLLIKEADTWKSYNNVFKHKAVDFFATEYFFPSATEGFDIVIGNPPYIQLQKDGGHLADIYKDQDYSTFARTGDIYSLFYERGMELSKQSTGLLCFITSNKWMRAGYGEQTRSYLASKNPIILIDFGGFKVFESAAVDTNILLIQNDPNTHLVKAAQFQNDFTNRQSVKSYFDNNSNVLTTLSSDTWFIGNPAELALKQKIEIVGTHLKDWNVNINYGVKTGCNEAFIIDEVTKNRLISEDKKSSEIIKPLLRGKDINRYDVKFKNMYILATGYDIDIQSNYPAIFNYIKSVGDRIDSGEIKVKGKGVFKRADQGINWWNLRACAYYDEFENEKLAWSDISTEPSFALLKPGSYINNTAYMINGNGLDTLLVF